MSLQRVPLIEFDNVGFVVGCSIGTGNRNLDTTIDANADAPDLLATGLDSTHRTLDIALGKLGRTTVAFGPGLDACATFLPRGNLACVLSRGMTLFIGAPSRISLSLAILRRCFIAACSARNPPTVIPNMRIRKLTNRVFS